MKKTYWAAVERGESSFGVVFADFPGCVTVADTLDAVAAVARYALQGHVEVGVDHGDDIPEPSQASLEQVEALYGESDWIAMIAVEIDVPVAGPKVAVPIDRELVRAIDATKLNRAAFVAEAVRHELARLTQTA